MSFIRGVLAGLAIGYLTAPRSGKETRYKLTQRANDLQGQWEDGVSQVKSQIDSLTGKAQNLAGKAHEKVNQYAGQAEQKGDQFKNDAKSTYNNTVDHTADAAQSGINRAEDALKVS